MVVVVVQVLVACACAPHDGLVFIYPTAHVHQRDDLKCVFLNI